MVSDGVLEYSRSASSGDNLDQQTFIDLVLWISFVKVPFLSRPHILEMP